MYEAAENRKERFRESVLDWAADNLRTFPWRETNDVYEVFIAELLLQRTRAETVEPIFERFIDRWEDWGALSRARESEVADLIRPLGLQNRRANALTRIAASATERGLPRTEDGLLALPRVGRYVANATLCFACGERRPIVDANVIRVYQRAFGFEDLNAREEAVWEFAWEVLPEGTGDVRTFNLALLDMGAEVCVPGEPRCGRCPASQACVHATGGI